MSDVLDTKSPLASDAPAQLPTAPIVTLDAKNLLARINPRIAALRRAITHRHDDEAWWREHGLEPRLAQGERAILRLVAHLLHVERATARGRIHGPYASLEEQRAWLEHRAHFACARAAGYAGVPANATLAKLRAGELVQAAP